MREKGRTCTSVNNPKDSYLLRHNLKHIRISHPWSLVVLKHCFVEMPPIPSLLEIYHTYVYVSIYTHSEIHIRIHVLHTQISIYVCVYIMCMYVYIMCLYSWIPAINFSPLLLLGGIKCLVWYLFNK